jgi:aminoacyl-tRNA hydrolase
MEAIAAEKGKLVAALPETGTAVLNADDPQVLAMAARCRGRVITYGLSPAATVRAENVRSGWPEGLSFDLVYDGRSYAVRTGLCGDHWVHTVLASIATAVAAGVPLSSALRAMEATEPVEGRLFPVTTPVGATLICDYVKAPIGSIPPALEFMRKAQAARKIVVIGTISDFSGSSRGTYSKVAHAALEVADLVLLVGPRSSKGLSARAHEKSHTLLAFVSVAAAADHLRDILRPGDLVLVKGSRSDGLDLIVERCTTPGARAGTSSGAVAKIHPAGAAASSGRVQAAAETPACAIVGLGNAGERFRDTPHNAGHRALDHLAQTLNARWEPHEQALVATTDVKGSTVHLVKPMTNINKSGPVVLRTVQDLGLRPDRCVLVFDDADLPLGATRMRQRGSDGGHRGVRSVLECLGTHEVPRVKIGVGIPGQRQHSSADVLRPLSAEELALIDGACREAGEKMLALAVSRTSQAAAA